MLVWVRSLRYRLSRHEFSSRGYLPAGQTAFCRFERPLRRACRANDNRALTAPEKPIVSRDLVEEANVIAGHRAVLPCNDDVSILRGRSRTHDLNQSDCFVTRYQSAREFA